MRLWRLPPLSMNPIGYQLDVPLFGYVLVLVVMTKRCEYLPLLRMESSIWQIGGKKWRLRLKKKKFTH